MASLRLLKAGQDRAGWSVQATREPSRSLGEQPGPQLDSLPWRSSKRRLETPHARPGQGPGGPHRQCVQGFGATGSPGTGAATRTFLRFLFFVREKVESFHEKYSTLKRIKERENAKFCPK